MSLFAKKAALAAVAPPKGKVEEILITDAPLQVREAIDKIVADKKIKNDADGRIKTQAAIAMPFAQATFLQRFAATGSQPEKLKFGGAVATGEGENASPLNKVQLIVQDWCGKRDVPNEQLALLTTILGEKRINQVVEEYTDFSFESRLLSKPGVMEVLDAAFKKLLASKILTEGELDKLLVATPVRRIKEGVLDQLPTLCDNDPDQMESLIDALKSNAVIYFL